MTSLRETEKKCKRKIDRCVHCCAINQVHIFENNGNQSEKIQTTILIAIQCIRNTNSDWWGSNFRGKTV